MPIIFHDANRHGRLQLPPGVSLAFDDKGAEDYFIKAGFAKKTSDKAVMNYAAGSVEIDPETVFADGPKKGQKVVEG